MKVRRSQVTARLIPPLLLIALTACDPAGEDASEAGTAPTATLPAAPVPPPEPLAAADTAPLPGEALALLVVINEHEIAAAEQAREKEVESEVLAFADRMHDAHSRNLAATRKLINEAADVSGSAPIMSMRASGETQLNRLSGLDGQAYAQAYIEAMVDDHRQALDMLDNRLIPATQDSAVREHLRMTREHIAAHLAQAEALQSQ